MSDLCLTPRHVMLFVYSILATSAPSLVADDTVDFGRDVRPILAKKCFACHGPDEEQRETDLRLDTAQSAYADLGEYRAIVPGKPEQSEVVRLIESDDDDVRMPPADSKLKLSDQEKRLIRTWIVQGARYQAHWAFVAATRPDIPNVLDKAWVRNAIDTFVLSRLETEGLTHSPQADRYTIVRRLYLDLLGLPPMPEQADRFVNDQRPDAYERLVDRLLASPHYAERWAGPWLDLARYADTNGYEKDRPRSMWAYRDWVIRALNADMPFDQFTVEQLAGDMLPNATFEQR